MYPMRYPQALTRLAHSSLISMNQFSEAFGKAIISVLADIDKNDLWDIIYQQLMSLEKPSSSKLTSILMFDNEQYRVYDILCNSWVPEHDNKHPYFFMTHHVVNLLQLKRIKYLLVAPTGVVSQNIGGRTIHSALKLRQFDGHHQTLSLETEKSREELLEIIAIIVEEISHP
nr:7604_t:CDS:1 [Entrophospora candida]